MKKLLSFFVLALVLTLALSCVSCKGNNTQEIGENELEFKLSEDEKYYSVVSIGNCTDTNVVIPEEYKGLPVTQIGNSAFKNCKSIESITIPVSIRYIDAYAFDGCNLITSLTIPLNAVLHDRALNGCKSVTTLNLGRIQLHFDYNAS